MTLNHQIKSLPVRPAPGQFEEKPELFGTNKEDPMDAAFREYNCFGIAEHADQYKLAEKDCQAMKAHPLFSDNLTIDTLLSNNIISYRLDPRKDIIIIIAEALNLAFTWLYVGCILDGAT